MSYVDSGYVYADYFGQPGSLCAFFSGTQSLIFDQPPQRPPRSLKLIQAARQTSGGDDIGYQVFATDNAMNLTWPRMHIFYLEQLQAWFKQVAKGMAYPFDYRQLDGSTISVRFGSPVIKVQEIMPDRYQVDIVLWAAS